jgi:hypothetical protein
MTPVGVVFLIVMLLFGIIGIVRGVARELGVTTMLLLALMVLQLTVTLFASRITHFLTQVFGVSAADVPTIIAFSSACFLMLMTFISYQGITLLFPIKSTSWFLGLGIGLINGYLFAGSMWYYLQKAGWPLLHSVVKPEYSQLNDTLYNLMPPAIFSWQALLLMVVALLILRIWK